MAFIDFAFFAVKGLICIWAAILILVGSRFLEDLIRGERSDEAHKECAQGGLTNVVS